MEVPGGGSVGADPAVGRFGVYDKSAWGEKGRYSILRGRWERSGGGEKGGRGGRTSRTHPHRSS